MSTLFRAVSQREKDDYDVTQSFRTSRNTLEAKQFFKTRTAVHAFVNSSVEQDYDPPYVYLLIVTINDDEFTIDHYNRELDGYQAIHIDENDLEQFNNYVIFVNQELL